MNYLKKTNYSLFLLLFCFLILSCTRSADFASPADVLVISDSDILGRWQIDKYIEGGIDESAEFADVTVDFGKENKVIIFKNNSKIYEGSWRIRLNKSELAINIFNAIDPYDEFEGDWYVTKKDANTLWILNIKSLGKEEFRMSK
ncbi:MAG: hypothetical protein EAZ08_04095 [Cytophagales bacterium]|nr:MAG: hypothetical protein EAZ08_04095 [Cytophagales bacterium]